MDKRLLLAVILTLLMVFTLPPYLNNEPTRMTASAASFAHESAVRGEKAFGEFCAECHGDQGQGKNGPALNTKQVLSQASDEVLFSLTRSGIPNTAMPSWGQAHGGPLTDQQIGDIVAFMRAWEKTAPFKIVTPEPKPDPDRGTALYQATCVTCHGPDGLGTTRVKVALNDKLKLTTHDDIWFFEVISKGRLDKGMPTWGKVLSPLQIRDVIAMLRIWELTAPPPKPTPDAVKGANFFAAECAQCHGRDGRGTRNGPALRGAEFLAKSADEQVAEVITNGRPTTDMEGFAQKFSQLEIADIIAFVRTLLK